MINLNLLPPGPRTEVRERAQYLLIKNTVIVSLFLTFFIAFIVLGARFYLDFKESRLTDEITTLQSQATTAQPLDEAISSINQKLDYISNIQGEYIAWSHRLKDLLNVIPQGIDVAALQINNDNNTILISGEAATRDQLLSLKSELENIDFVSTVNLPVSSLSLQTDISFQLTIEITSKNET
ncbi:PilN domain-containing protein [Patescibacteria group bacterium]